MATAKKKKRAKKGVKPKLPNPPNALTAPEKHPLLAYKKGLILRHPDLARRGTLANIVEVGWYLVALRREKEARELAEWIAANVVFKKNDDVWVHTANAILLGARIARRGGENAAHKKLVARVTKHPALERMEWPWWDDWRVKARTEIDRA